MGKTTGFLDYVRREDPVRDPARRVGDYEEFHGVLPPQARQEQGGRCMNCGVPFCQSGHGAGGRGLRLPPPQPDPRVERYDLAGERRPRPVPAFKDQQLSRVHRPGLSRPLRDGLASAASTASR